MRHYMLVLSTSYNGTMINPELPNFGNCSYTNVNELNTYSNENKLSLLNINMRSLKNKFTILLAFINIIKTPIDLIVVTETWLDDANATLFPIPGYKIICINRSTTGGGVYLYYR